ncbi:MAG: DUF2798 domain-containing protein [Hyphomicrobiaceae bacterium]|nr:DUF2798 domain-containing protein [Hyphomicrobiaceae bacterium]
MTRLPKRFAPLAYGVIQSGVTTGFATATATYQALGLERFATTWPVAWGLAWLMMVPVVVVVSPLIQRAVLALVEPD